MLCYHICVCTFEVFLCNSFPFSHLFPRSPLLQVTLSSPPAKRTTCRTPATARSLPAPASVRWTLCRLRGPKTVAAAATGLRPVRRRRQRPPRSRTAQRRCTRTSPLTTASRAPGNRTYFLSGEPGGGGGQLKHSTGSHYG